MPEMLTVVARLGLICVALSLVGCGGGDEYSATASDMIDTLNDLNQVMDGVTDKASAEKAVPQLEKIAARMKTIEARVEELGDPPADVQKALEEQYQEPMEQAMNKMLEHMGRIMFDPEINAVLQPVFNDLQVQ